MKRRTKERLLLILLTIAFFLSLFNAVKSQTRYELPTTKRMLEKSEQVLKSKIGIREDTKQGRAEVMNFLRSVGIKSFTSWCAAYQYYGFYVADSIYHDGIPIPRSGVAQSAFDYAAKYGTKTAFTPQKHDLLIYKSKDWTGHQERIDSVYKAGWVTTYAGNTGPPSGSQRNGDGAYKKRRNIYHPLGRMRTRGLVGFKYGEHNRRR